MTREEKIRQIVELVNKENGIGIEATANLLDVSDRTAGKWLRRATEAGLLVKSLDDDGYFLYTLSSKGESFLEKENPKKREVDKMADTNDREDMTYTLPADLLDTIDEIADDEGRDINELVEELLNSGLDSLYPESDDADV